VCVAVRGKPICDCELAMSFDPGHGVSFYAAYLHALTDGGDATCKRQPLCCSQQAWLKTAGVDRGTGKIR
jgi:hypothetical protein